VGGFEGRAGAWKVICRQGQIVGPLRNKVGLRPGFPVGSPASSLFGRLELPQVERAGPEGRAAESPSLPNYGAAKVQGAVQIVVGKRATALERYAGKELQRYLHAVFGVYGTLADDGAPLDRPSCLVGRPESNARIAALIENKTIHLAQGDPGGAVKCDRSDSVIWAWFSEG